jgi:hypothetical protein
VVGEPTITFTKGSHDHGKDVAPSALRRGHQRSRRQLSLKLTHDHHQRAHQQKKQDEST